MSDGPLKFNQPSMLELPLLKIKTSHLLRHPAHRLLERRMRWILLRVIPPVLLARKLDYKAVRVDRLRSHPEIALAKNKQKKRTLAANLRAEQG
ncbi:hypothetical protein MMC21_006447 [Puttea exsequens]|nr:hypothetical protein [Puttea exsequens]